MAKSQRMALSFFPEKSSGSPALNLVGLDIRATSMQLSSAGSYVSSLLSLVKVMLGSRTGSEDILGRVEMVMARGSNAAGDSRRGGMFEFLQGLCILLSPPSLDGLPVSGR